MAKIPRFFNSNRSNPGTVGVQVNPNQQASYAATGQEGRALIEAGNKLQKIAQIEMEKEAAAFSNTALVNFQLDAAKKYEEVMQNPSEDPRGISNQYNQWFAKKSQELLQNAPAGEATNRMANSITKLGGQYQLKGARAERQLVTTRVLEQTDQTMNRLVNVLNRDPGQYNEVVDQLHGMVENLQTQGISQEAVRSAKEKALNMARMAQLNGRMFNGNAVEVIKEIGAGIHDDLKPNQLAGLVRKANEISQEAMAISTYHTGGSRDPNARSRERFAFDQKNKEHRKIADTAYRHLKTEIADRPREEQMAAKFSFLRQGRGLIAPELQSEIRSNITSGTVENKVLYSKMLVEMENNRETRPAANEFEEKVRKEAFLIEKFSALGMGAQESVERARDITAAPATDDVLIQRRVELKDSETLKQENVKNTVEDFFDNIFMKDPANLNAATEDYKRVYRNIYEQTGDEDLAERMAETTIKKNYAVSTINGQEELMRDAPEIVFQNRAEEVKDSWKSFVKNRFELADNIQGTFGENKNPENPFTIKYRGENVKVKLKPYFNTRQTGKYMIVFDKEMRSGGREERNILDENGVPLLFAPQLGEDESLAEVLQEAKDLKAESDRLGRKLTVFEKAKFNADKARKKVGDALDVKSTL